MTLGTHIKKLREKLKLTQDALAKAVGCSKGHVYDIEAGRKDNISAKLLKRIGRALKHKNALDWIDDD